jgi:hypothetical protein
MTVTKAKQAKVFINILNADAHLASHFKPSPNACRHSSFTLIRYFHISLPLPQAFQFLLLKLHRNTLNIH